MRYEPPFESADPSAGYINGTSKIDQHAIESPLRELANLIVTAGLTPNQADNTQVAQAITALIMEALDGYIKPSHANAGFIMPPEVFEYVDTNVFTLNTVPKFATEVLVLKDGTFSYLQNPDYLISGNTITINAPALVAGDKIKVVYAV